jgi:5-formyltetrahydrofolate cyclo-ligase
VDKRELRDQYRAIREGMANQEVIVASQALCTRLAEWKVLQEARTVLTYIAFRNEIDLSQLLELVPDTRWIAPRVEGQRLVLHPYDPGRLIRHRFGMLEPAADLPTVEPNALDLVLVPGVAFDRRGGRLGFGGGFYDHFLPTTQALRVGVTHDRCLVDKLPMGDHDQWMDWVVTPSQLINCGEQPR